MADSDTDRKNIELDALFKRADDVVATSVIGRPKRGSGYIPKVDAKIRLNAEVMAWLKDMGPRHYSRINGLLTALMELDKSTRAEMPAEAGIAGQDSASGMQTESSAPAASDPAGESAAPSNATTDPATESTSAAGEASSAHTREKAQG